MCGITGLLERAGGALGGAELEARARAMAARLAHRGPDAGGGWSDPAAGVALGHRRLSILDLSPLGAQPMASGSGRYVATFNGEIYNFGELRERLEAKGHRFRGRSDTEVMLAAFEQWGMEQGLKELDGMFALGVWDRELRELWLARDRLGEKPLYYGWCGGALVFGSELKALMAHPAWEGRIDRAALSLYFRYNCIPAPYSVFEGVRKLPAGTWFRLGAEARPGELPEPQAYWSLREEARASLAAPFRGSVEDAEQELERVLQRAVARRMVADVPLGAFLSGGIDSSLVVALMRKATSRAVRTFTIGFAEQGFDEAAQAARVARHLGTEHTEARLSPEEALKVVPELPRFYDEPFSDSSQVATLLVARHARRHVTVCLSGDGGDEFFAGYHRHFLGPRLWRAIRGIPAPLRAGAAGALRGVPAPAWARLGGWLGRSPQHFAAQARKLIEALPARGPGELYLSLVSHTRDPAAMVPGAHEPPTLATQDGWDATGLGGTAACFQYLDAMTYLPDDILTKVDRATMAVSLEARVPFLAPEVIRFAWSLPESFKVREGQGKWLLRRVLARHLPPELILKPKSGFAVPIGPWLRGPLKDWAAALLEERALKAEGYLDAHRVRRLWDEHQGGARNREYELWDVLMFQAWLAESGRGVTR
jgi:asparagine synthase (glutamine-hydrolysing)